MDEIKTEPKYDVLLTRAEVAQRLRIGMRTLARMDAAGALPPRIQVTDRITGYRTSAIEKFLNDRTVAS